MERKLMPNFFGKNPSILKKFLLINFIIFSVIVLLTIFYLMAIEPSLVKKKSSDHIQIIDNTIHHIERLNIRFEKNEIARFLFSTRFLFQSLDRVQFFDNDLNLLGDTNVLDLDPRSFSKKFEVTELKIGEIETESNLGKSSKKNQKKNKIFKIENVILKYKTSKNFGNPFTINSTINNNYIVSTIKNVNIKGKNLGYLVISELSNEIIIAVEERKNFILRTVLAVALVIFVFSIFLNQYLLSPIKSLVDYTKSIKDKDVKTDTIEKFLKRKDEVGLLSNSLNDMTQDLYKKINIAETFSTDLTHEIRNPLASLKGASELLDTTDDPEKRSKLLKIISHDVQRIERLITDYSQMLKDEAALSREKMKKIDVISIVKSVIDDFNNDLLNSNKNIKIKLDTISDNKTKPNILGVENRVEQVLANLLDNSISFSPPNSEIKVLVKSKDKIVKLAVEDQGPGFNEKNIEQIFNRFYSNRPEKFGEQTGLGLNIVKHIIELHGGSINASNNTKGIGAKININFPEYSI
jgi:two-component system sensor histidine kinase ChvG